MKTAKEFLNGKINTNEYDIRSNNQYNKNSNMPAIWIDPDQHNFSIEYLKKVARKMGFHAKGIATIIIW